MGRLLNPRHEQFAAYVAQGKTLTDAYSLAFGRETKGSALRGNASRLWNHLAASPQIRARVSQTMAKRRKAAELTEQRLLDDMLLECELASAAGQHSAAITGRKLLGQELFGMFTDRRETSIDVNFSHIRTKDDLRQSMVEDFGEEATDYLFQLWAKPKLIEHGPQNINQSHQDDHTSHTNGAADDQHQEDENQPVGSQNHAETSDSASEGGPVDDMARLAARSLQDSKPRYRR